MPTIGAGNGASRRAPASQARQGRCAARQDGRARRAGNLGDSPAVTYQRSSRQERTATGLPKLAQHAAATREDCASCRLMHCGACSMSSVLFCQLAQQAASIGSGCIGQCTASQPVDRVAVAIGCFRLFCTAPRTLLPTEFIGPSKCRNARLSPC